MSLLVQFILTVICSVISRMGAFLWCIHTVGDYSGWLTVMKIRIKNIGRTSYIRRHYGVKHCKGQQHWPSFVDGKITNLNWINWLLKIWIDVGLEQMSQYYPFLTLFYLYLSIFSFIFFFFFLRLSFSFQSNLMCFCY